MSDNGPPFNSTEFQLFSKFWMFKHQTSSPRYPQSNGQVESMIKTVKNMLRKAELDGTDFYLCLLELMNTPLSNTIPSPAQIMFNRRLRTKIPTNEKLYKPKFYSHSYIKKQLEIRQNNMKKYYDRGARELTDLNEGDVVKVKNFNENKWIDGIVLSKLDQPRSYKVVLSDSRNVIIRNRKHLVLVSKKTCSNKIVDKVLNYEIPHYEESSSNTSKEEQILDNVPNPVHLELLSRSKSGRTIKAPQKLNL